jgi:hypothetical protein
VVFLPAIIFFSILLAPCPCEQCGRSCDCDH